MAMGQLQHRPPNPHVTGQLEYTSHMTQTTSTPALAPTPFRLEFDFSTEGFANIYEAIGAMLADSVQPGNAIISVRYMGSEANGWPTVSITFASIECAKAFTYAYLGYTLDNADQWDAHTDDEVGEYVSYGEFV